MELVGFQEVGGYRDPTCGHHKAWDRVATRSPRSLEMGQGGVWWASRVGSAAVLWVGIGTRVERSSWWPPRRGWKGKGGWRGVQTVILPPQVGQGYPHDPPKVKCETMVYHPNIDLEGNVCLNILRWDTGVVEVVVAVPSGAESHFGPTYPSGWNGV